MRRITAEIERLNAVFKRECALTVELRAEITRLRAEIAQLQDSVSQQAPIVRRDIMQSERSQAEKLLPAYERERLDLERAKPARYTIAPPSLTPLLQEYGDYENIPDERWREYIAAHAFWARAWLMYADAPKRNRKPRGEVARPA
jgi:hypothetical protein